MGDNIKKLNLTRFLVLGILLFFCVGLEYYFHIVLGTIKIYPHLFYVPIAVAAFWWGLKGGLLVASSLGLMNFVSYFPSINEIALVRCLALIFVGSVIGTISDKRNKAERELYESKVKLEAIFQCTCGGIRAIDMDYKIIDQNKEMGLLCGIEKTKAVEEKCSGLFHSSFCDTDKCTLRQILSGVERVEIETEKTTDDGKIIPVSLIATPLKNEEGKIVGVIEGFQDITRCRQAEDALRESELRYRTTLDSMGDAIHVVGPDFRIELFNAAIKQWCKELGLGVDIIGRSVFETFPFLSDKALGEYQKVFDTGEILITEEYNKIKDREIITKTRKIPIFEKNKVVHVVTVVKDITKRKKMDEEKEKLTKELKRLARTDGLTGILNRQYLDKRLESEAQRAKRYGHLLSVIMLDIDHFKEVNDNFGHQMGDKVLKMIAKSIKETIRANDFVGRYGGEEFFVVCVETAMDEATRVAERIRAAIEQLQAKDEKRLPVKVTASFGVAQYNESETLDSLLTRVDNVLYKAKNEGRNRVRVAEEN